MTEQLAKIALGSVLYIAVLWVAQRNPRAAGMMLTFPTLNGIVLLMAEPARLEAVASAMIVMPMVNAVLATGYLAGFERLVDRRPAGASAGAAALSAMLIAVVAASWLAVAVCIATLQARVPAGAQAVYGLAALAIGIAMTALPGGAADRPRDATGQPPLGLVGVLRRHRWRIALFAASVTAIAIVDRIGGSTALLGALAGMPIVGFFGLHSIASDAGCRLADRRAALAAMAGTVWLGPPIAIAFVACFWRWLESLATTVEGVGYLAIGAVSLSIGWSLCIGAIWGLARLAAGRETARAARRSG